MNAFLCPPTLMLCSLKFWKSSYPFKKIISFFFYTYNLFFGCSGSSLLHRFFSSCGEWGLFFIVVHGPLTVVAFLKAEHRLQQLWHMGSVVVAPRLWSTESIAVVHGLSCSSACGILPDGRLNPCLLHWQVLPLSHQGSPKLSLFLSVSVLENNEKSIFWLINHVYQI